MKNTTKLKPIRQKTNGLNLFNSSKILMVIGMMIGMFGFSTNSWGQCNHTISLYDSYGDGWHGNNSVDVIVDGSTVLNDITLASGSGPANYTFSASTGSNIQVTFVGGSYPGECYFDVEDGTGTLLVDDRYPDSQGNWSGTGNCGTTCDYSVPYSGNNSITASTGFICDENGWGTDYNNNANGYTVINPVSAGDMVELSFTHFELEGCCDYVRVFDGTGTGGTELWSGNGTSLPPDITSTTGPLTIQFTSDGSVIYDGFRAEISNIYVPPSCDYSVPYSGNNSITASTGFICDENGWGTNYNNSANGYTVINPISAGDMVSLTFTHFDTESSWDYVYIYDGAGTTGTLLWSGSGSALPPVQTSTTGPLTIQFTSDGSVTYDGFRAEISNIYVPPSCDYSVPYSGNNSITASSGFICDENGLGTNYNNSANGYTVINPVSAGDMVSLTFTHFDTESSYDYVYIYDGAGTTGTLLWSGSGSALPPVQTSTTGPLTIQFTSDGSVTYDGFRAEISNIYVPPSCDYSVPYSGNNSITTSSGFICDENGWGTSYNNSANGYTVINPVSAGDVVSLTFTHFELEGCCDYVRVFDGTGTGGTELWSGFGTTLPPVITSTTGPLTIQFTSDGSATYQGFRAEINNAGLPGDEISVPFSIGSIDSYTCGSSYTTSINTTAFSNTTGNGAPDVFYSFSISSESTVNINTCTGSDFDTYLRLYDSGNNQIFTNDDNCGVQSQIEESLTAGTYTICVEGYGSSSGTAGLEVSIINPQGDCLDNPLSIGTLNGNYDCGSTYTESVVTSDFINTQDNASEDVYYSFVITSDATVNINTCTGSDFDTYLRLFDSGNNQIHYNDDDCGTRSQIEETLAAGTYTIGVEGYSANSGTAGLEVSIVRPLFTPGAINTTGETICYNGNPIAIGSSSAASGGDGSITYKWQADGVDIASSNSATYDPPAGLTSTTTYTRWAHDGTCNTSWEQSGGSWTVTVNPDFTPGAINSTGETICYSGDPATIGSTTAASGGDGSITYKWQADGVDIASSNAATYNPPTGLTSNTTYTRWAHDGTCNTGWEQSTGSWTVTVRPDFTPGAINTIGETICYNEDPSVIGSSTAASGGDNSITYEWRANGNPLASSNSATYNPPSGLTTTTTYTRWAHDGSCNTSWTQSTGSWTVTVRPDFTPGAINTSGETICYNGDPGVIGSTTAASGGDGIITYSWRSSTDGYTAAIVGATGATYTPPAGLTSTTSYRRYAKDNTCNTTPTVATGTWTVTVNPDFTAGAINTTGETICSGGDPTAIGSATAASGGDGSITYKWQANGSDIASSNSASYNPPAGLTSSTTYTRWAQDGTCNTSWTQSSGSWTVTVETPPAPAGLDAGDYYWAGEISNSWNNANNWLLYDGSSYSVPASIPDATSDVFIKSYATTCGTTNALTDASTTVYAKDINIQTELSIGNSAQLNVSGDFYNYGTFNAGTGTIVLNGIAQQTIQPGGDNFHNLTINNTSGLFDAIVLDDDIHIAGHLQLTQGIIDGTIAPYKIKLLNGATANSGNANSFVNGEVERTGTTAFIYPVGDVANIDGTDRAIWAPIETDACALSTISANYYYENPPFDWWYHGGNMDATIDHVTDREYWDLVTDNATPAVTIYWTDNTDDLHSFGTTSGEMTPTFLANNMTIAHYNTALGKWDDMGATIPAGPIYFDDGSIKTTTAFSSYSPITFASKNPTFTLPVELVDFSANCMDEYVEINWTSATEINNEYYRIERSKDGSNWATISKVPGAGNSNTTIDYQVIDEKFNSGMNYYRLTQFDFDGSSETFGLRTVNCDNETLEPEITIYPNPFTNDLNLLGSNWQIEGKVNINITDMSGRVLQTYNVHVENQRFHLLMQMSNLTPGMYILEIQGEQYNKHFKVQKK